MRGAETYWVCAIALAVGLVAGPFVRAKAITRTTPPLIEAVDAQSPVIPPASSPLQFSAPTDATTQTRIMEPAPAQPSLRPPRLPLTYDEVADLAERCAPAEPSKVMASIVRVESAGHPLRIGVNGKRRWFLEPSTPAEAAAWASRLIAAGANIDLGLAQINGRNLPWLGLSIEDAFDPCRNLAAAGIIIDGGYRAALKISRPNQSVLQTAYSLYNTGDPDRGLVNGYVSRLEAGVDQRR